MAAAKINLALHVLAQRPDSYHDLSMVTAFADFGDSLKFEPIEDKNRSHSVKLEVTGSTSSGLGKEGDNLILRAAEALVPLASDPLPVRIRLDKKIPVGAGLGGGSADAAATLEALDVLWKCQHNGEREGRAGSSLRSDHLAKLGVRLGADVPMCLTGRALHAAGVGEVITPLEKFPSLAAVLIWPGATLSTPAVFASLDKNRQPGTPIEVPHYRTVSDVINHMKSLGNDLEQSAIGLAPVITDVLAALTSVKTCQLSRMTGSGSACFGLFATRAQADAAAQQLAIDSPSWWVRSTTLT